MERSSTVRREERGEITFESLKRAALEGLYTFFTPARVLVRILGWPFRQMTRIVRPQNQTPARKEASLRSQR